MSASSKPILSFFFDKDVAKLTEIVDFPTPPFPDAITIISLTINEPYKKKKILQIS